MSVWVAIPSARPVDHVNAWAEKWRAQGYKVALWRDKCERDLRCDLLAFGAYPGYAEAVNRLAKVLLQDAAWGWIVACGDDTLPDPNKSADEIAWECSTYFARVHAGPDASAGQDFSIKSFIAAVKGLKLSTFGIMQPTGHRWGENDPHSHAMWPNAPAYIDRICGSPWLGREWCLRGNQGAGPFHPGFWHMHGDECLQETAKKLGILWQRRDLTHFHDHWGLTGNALRMPEFLAKANSPEHWRESKALLERLRAADFAECMPI